MQFEKFKNNSIKIKLKSVTKERNVENGGKKSTYTFNDLNR